MEAFEHRNNCYKMRLLQGQNFVATKWRIYKTTCEKRGNTIRDGARILYLLLLCL